MRYIIKNRQTQLYYCGGARWDSDPRCAYTFPTTEFAERAADSFGIPKEHLAIETALPMTTPADSVKCYDCKGSGKTTASYYRLRKHVSERNTEALFNEVAIEGELHSKTDVEIADLLDENTEAFGSAMHALLVAASERLRRKGGGMQAKAGLYITGGGSPPRTVDEEVNIDLGGFKICISPTILEE